MSSTIFFSKFHFNLEDKFKVRFIFQAGTEFLTSNMSLVALTAPGAEYEAKSKTSVLKFRPGCLKVTLNSSLTLTLI